MVHFMMIKLIICFIITIILYASTLKILHTTCDENTFYHVDKIYGSKIEGIKLARTLGYPTINLKLEQSLPCGFYNGETEFGKVTIIVGRHDRYRADVNFLHFKREINAVGRFEITNVNRIVNDDSDIIKTFNNGCCQ